MAILNLTPEEELKQGKFPAGSKRSSKWDGVRKEHLKNHPICEICEGKARLNVHHIKPFHLHPELELEPTNLITLCESNSHGINCHLLVGHLGNFKNINPTSVEDSKIWKDKLKEKHFDVECK
jgi:predicted TIM-barrel fold metal-dependent hydrolase